MRRAALISFVALVSLLAGVAAADPLVASPAVRVTGPSPYPGAPACMGAPQTGTVYPGAEVEPWVAADPTRPGHLIGVWQQDRWSNGGATANGTAVSDDGGQTWTVVPPPTFSRCSGGTAANGGDYERATDPWVSIGPDGIAYQASLSFSDSTFTSAVLVSTSRDGGRTWSSPSTVIRDSAPPVFNDKETITADPTRPGHAYVVWDRLVFPNERASRAAAEHALGFRGPTWFSRTTDGGRTWEPARMIFDPGQINQTIGSQIVVLPDGTLVNVFNVIYNFKNAHKIRGMHVAVQRSTDAGLTWSRPILVDRLGTVGVVDPTTGEPVRTGDIIPEAAVDPASGRLYVAWQDARFSGGAHDGIALSWSDDGGRTWSPTTQVNQVPGAPAFTPSVHVADDGTVGVLYTDFRRDTADPSRLQTDHWLVHRHGDAEAWSETQVGDTFDMRQAPVARGYFIGDYEGLTSLGPTFVPFFVQTNEAAPANRTDVFSARVG